MAQRVPPIPQDEAQRLQALLQYRVLDTQPEPVFDNITRLAALVCDVPMVAITLVDEKRQWFKSRFGLTITESPRDIAFCSYTIAAGELLVVDDAKADPRFRDNPLVKSDPEIRFYAGAPLITPQGYAIGTLAVMDRVTRKLNSSQQDALRLLASQTIEQLEFRRRGIEATAALHALLDAAPSAISALDLEGNAVLWNRRAEQMFGYKSEEVIGKPIPTMPPEASGIIDEVMSRLLKGEPVVSFENRRSVHKGGHIVETNLHMSAVRNEKGEIIGTVGFIDDVTEKNRIERNLIELGTMVESSEDAIIGGTLDGIVVAWNRGAEKLYGYTAEEMIGHPIAVVYPPDREEERFRIAEAMKRGESIHNLETVRLRKNGERVQVSVTLSPVKDADGNATGVSNVVRDITDKKAAESKLEHSLSLMRATLEATADGILALDRHGKVLGMNQRFAELWRLPKDILDTRDTQRGIEYAATQLREPEYFWQKIRRYFTGEELDPYDLLEFKDGRVLERYLHPQIVGGEAVGYVFSYRDITRRRQLEEQLRQAQKMEAVGQLAGGIAHDFNNLLNVIIGYNELTKMSLRQDDPLRANVDHVMKAAERAADLTRQLLIFSRKQVPHFEILVVNKIVSSMSAMLRRLIGEDIELSMSLAADAGNIKADAGQLEQVVMNLVINARDAMPKGGKVEISTFHRFIARMESATANLVPGDYLVLAIKDNGTGMSEEVKAHIFEPFFTTKEPGKGTGLGLATVYGIVHQSGGEIEVESALGQGTTFRVFFPAVQQNSFTQNASTENPPLRGRESVLVVEDEDSLRKLISESLRQQGYTVLQANNGTAAMEVLRNHQGELHLLITDVVMPGMRGWELARKVAEQRPGIRVLYISGYTDKGLLDPGVLGPNSAFLQKPFTPSTLAQKVRSFLGSAAT